MADLMGIGTSGLLAFKRALATTGHNISNVNTDGYSRQSVELGARDAAWSGSGYVGQGVQINGIERAYDEFLVNQVRMHQAASARMDTLHEFSSQVDNLLADPNAGLSPALEDFSNAVQGVADNPSSIPARQVMLSNAESLVDRFHYLDSRLDDLHDRANGVMESTVEEINSLAHSIADLNKEISRKTGGAGGMPPNDLLDQRDLLLKQLSEKITVQTVEQDDHQINVFIGTGQGIVVGSAVNTLGLRYNEFEPKIREVIIEDVSGVGGINVTRLLTGGVLGGATEFVDNVVQPMRNLLGRVAIGLGTSFNEQHALGIDLHDQVGGDFFRAPVPVSSPAQGNSGGLTGEPTLAVQDIGLLSKDDYIISYDGANWNIVNRQTGQVPADLTTAGTVFTTGGITIDTSSIVGPAAGDKFLIRPTGYAARDIDTALDDPSRIAAAGALAASEPTDGTGQPTNLGTASLSGLKASAASGLMPLGGGNTIQLTYTAAGDFNVTVPGGWTATPAPISYDPLNDEGVPKSVTIDDGGGNTVTIEMAFQGTPQVGDSFTIGDNSGAVSDNRNALELSALQERKVLVSGSASFQSAYGQMVADVGTKTRQAEIGRDAERALFSQAVTAAETISGVNLDEEAANLLRYQQAYQATTRVISAAQNLFDTLLDTVR